MRQVLGEILAESGIDGTLTQIPEIIAINKADVADPVVVNGILAKEKSAHVVSARTGEGIPELLEAISELLPRPDIEVNALVPYARGDLVAKVHEHGQVLDLEHTAEGTRLRARVTPALAADLTGYAC